MAKRIKFLKLQMTQENIDSYVDLLTSIKMPFTLEISNYTTRIRSQNYNVYFVKKEMSLRTFAAAAMIKKDFATVRNPPKTQPHQVEYYNTNFRHEFFSDVCHNIDLKSAYANILYLDGFITGKTFEYLSKLDKMERLAAVGMCASKKEIYHHSSSGKVIADIVQINPLAPFFFHCVKRTAEIINDLRVNIIQDCFLFSWVDSIYYLNHNESYKRVSMEYLKEQYKMDSTFKELINFEVKIKNEYYNIKFEESCSGKVKTFNIPFEESKIKKKVIHHLLTKKYN